MTRPIPRSYGGQPRPAERQRFGDRRTLIPLGREPLAGHLLELRRIADLTLVERHPARPEAAAYGRPQPATVR